MKTASGLKSQIHPATALMPKRNFKKFPRRGTIASDDQNDALWWAAAEGKLDLVEGALKKGWSLKRDPFDVVKDDPYADIEYDRSWSDPQYELVHDENFENYGSTALHRAAIFDNGENTEKVCKMLIDAGWDCKKIDKDGYTPADDAYAVGNINLALYIRSKQDRD